MTTTPANSPPTSDAGAATEKTLRRLFLTLFLRGRRSRGLQKETAPASIGQKLALTLGLYVLFGCMALFFFGQPVFALAVYLHAMTFVFLGMFVASSAGEILFNDEEADILLHRPISPQALLRAKVSVLVKVSLWLAFAFNLAGMMTGTSASDGDWRFPFAHAVSTCLEALFCTGFVVMIYQLCLRWFGRERLDGLMTGAQVIVSIAAVLSGQILPRLVFSGQHIVNFDSKSWWIALLPPAWFAGIDDALAGSMAAGSWQLAAMAVVATAIVVFLAFGKLARDYATGLQRMSEVVSTRSRATGARRRWLDRLANLPPMRLWLRDPVERASFLLVGAYLLRDRDVKLRLYPALTPTLIWPVILLFGIRGNDRAGDVAGAVFGIVWAGFYLGMIPLFALNLLQYSQHWQASDIFRAAPMRGPGPLLHGARRAVLCLMVLPLVLTFGALVWLLDRDRSQLVLLLPGIISLPVYALIPALHGKSVPFSLPAEGAKSAGRGLTFMICFVISLVLALLMTWAWTTGWFWWAIVYEILDVAGIYFVMRRSFAKFRWRTME